MAVDSNAVIEQQRQQLSAAMFELAVVRAELEAERAKAGESDA